MDMDVDMDVAPRNNKEILKVVEGMNEEDLKKYMFPHYTVQPSYHERSLCMELDAPFKLDNPPPNVGQPFDPKHNHDREVAHKLVESEMKEFHKPKYYKRDAYEMKPGEAVDLKSMLFPRQGDYLVRRKGRAKIKAKNLKGKYIFVCCSYAPIFGFCSLWDVIYACSEFYSKLKGNFEMVVVTKMRHGWTQPRAKEKDAFCQFFSAFPPPCLAVPIHARSRRHRIFNSLGVGCSPKLLLVGPDGDVLLHKSFNQMDMIDLVPINVIGSDPTPFPFMPRISRPECSWIVNSPSSLKRLLSPSSDFLFRKIMSSEKGGSSELDPFVKEEATLSDLNSTKPVTLYLYSDGEKLPLLRHIAEGCGQASKDLEVVVVYLPISKLSLSFPEIFSRVLAPRRLSWWVAPFNLSASIVLDHMFQFEGDRVIIIGPNEQYVDIRGLQLMQIYGIFAYPFTFDSVVQTTVEELKQVTLDSFKKMLQILPACEEYSSTANKAVFYFDVPYSVCPSVCKKIPCFSVYKEVDIYFISFADNEALGWHSKNVKPGDPSPTDLTFKLLWHTNGANKAKDFFLRFFNRKFPTIVAFGEDGRISSVLAHELPPSGHPPDHPPELKGNLCEEVSSILEKYLENYDQLEYKDEGCFDHGLAYRQELRQSKFW